MVSSIDPEKFEITPIWVKTKKEDRENRRKWREKWINQDPILCAIHKQFCERHREIDESGASERSGRVPYCPEGGRENADFIG